MTSKTQRRRAANEPNGSVTTETRGDAPLGEVQNFESSEIANTDRDDVKDQEKVWPAQDEAGMAEAGAEPGPQRASPASVAQINAQQKAAANELDAVEPTEPAHETDRSTYSRTVVVPLDAQQPSAQFCLHIDVRLDMKQSSALRRIAAELDRRGARLANRQRVVHPTHAIKYLLELVDAAAAQHDQGGTDG